MTRHFAILLLAAALGEAQQVVAPTPEAVGSPRGDNTPGYNIVDSFEVGYRFRTLDGNYGKYRSDVNLGNGLRLLGSRLTIHSKEGHGRLFDELALSTQGLGNDPYQMANFRLQKNGLYRYDLLWRLNEFYNPALTVSGGQHLHDTRRRLQDHDFTLFPQSRVRFMLGYSRNSQTGPALTTLQAFDSRGDEFPLFADVRRQQNEYRLGGDVTLMGMKFHWLRGWENFKEDTPFRILAPLAGNNTRDNTTLTRFRRDEPYHGNSPYWRLALTRDARRFAVHGRFTQVDGRRDFVLDESALGTDRFASARNRQIVVTGNGRRPVVTGNLTLSLYPAERLTITNHTSFHNTRMEGDNRFVELDNGLRSDAILNFRLLGVRAVSNLTDATFAATNWISLYGGYHYSQRRIRSVEQESIDRFTDRAAAEQENRVNSGLFGVRLRPVKPLTITLDGEVGRADRPFYPISEKDYHAFSARAQYKQKALLLSAWMRTNYNFNTVSLVSHSSRSRQYAFDASYTASTRVAFDGGYSKLHLDTASALAYFSTGRLVDTARSLYFSNIHTGNVGVRFAVLGRADVYVGYTRVQDAGDGRAGSNGLPASLPAADAIATRPFYLAQTFPLAYQSPLARLSIRLHGKLRWNVGYQHYSYREDFYQLTYQNYRAHTGYTSVLWSF